MSGILFLNMESEGRVRVHDILYAWQRAREIYNYVDIII